MQSVYTRNGQQILIGERHMADAADENCARMILNALRALEERGYVGPPERPYLVGERPVCRAGREESTAHVYARPSYSNHTIRREGDEFACSCGLRWGVSDADPHTD